MNKKTLFITVGALGVIGLSSIAGAFGLHAVAATVNNGDYPAIIKNLAAKFNAQPADVAQVFTETRNQNRFDHLNQLVTDGVITEAQKTALIAKEDEIQAKITEINNKSLTEAERRTEIQKVMTDFQTWKTENKIAIGGGMMGGERGGKGGMGGEMMGEKGFGMWE
ncbi:MAG: hypothetical protein WCJ58_00735 [bacterium]